MASLENMPAEVHFQILSYFSTATFSPMFWFMSMRANADMHTAWNQISRHPLLMLSRSSKILRNVVEAYCEHRLQHLLATRPLGKRPETPFSSPYCISYLKHMAGHCTFCYEPIQKEWSTRAPRGAVDFTIPVCGKCKDKFPTSRMIRWKRVEEKYDLPLEELKATCAWTAIEETIRFDDSDYDYDSDDDWYYRRTFGRERETHQSRKSYVFDEREIQRYIMRHYRDMETFFAALEKKRWDKKLELERMAKQRRWAREEIERRVAVGEAMAERFIAQHKEVEKKRAAEKHKLHLEREARGGEREGMFREWQETFLYGTARPGGRNIQMGDWVRLDDSWDNGISQMFKWEIAIENHVDDEEKVARDILIQHFRLYTKQQATADVLLQYGLDSLDEPAKPEKKRGRDRGGLRW
jgi:hypothetical protein